jgi:5-methyltetrahydrofolate--homocysteine methyltransferase
MGTMLQSYGLSGGHAPESWNFERPEVITEIYKAYKDAGARLIETNTFGANRLKLGLMGIADRIKEINIRAVELAKEVAGEEVMIAGSIGPTGKLMEPHGDLSFNKARDVFKEQIAIQVDAGIDVVIIETMIDLQEIKAAIIAAKELDIPIIAQMTFTEGLFTLNGNSPEVVAITLDSLGADVIGVNCTPGSKATLPIIKRMSMVTDKPLSVYPNAGLPELRNSKVYYPETVEEFIKPVFEFLDHNIRLFGGCCGTTPEFISALADKVKEYNKKSWGKRKTITGGKTYLSSNRTYIEIANNKGVFTIANIFNPETREDFKKALLEEKWSNLRKEAKKQVDAGVNLLNLNIEFPWIDKVRIMERLIKELQMEVKVPLVIDTEDYKVLEIALRDYSGKVLINSVNGDYKIMERIFPLASEYGAAVIGLTFDEKGIPTELKDKFEIAKRIVNVAEETGLKREDIIIDTFILSEASNQKELMVGLETLRKVKDELGVNTIMCSDISCGLPVYSIVDEFFLSKVLEAGLNIINISFFNEKLREFIMEQI